MHGHSHHVSRRRGYKRFGADLIPQGPLAPAGTLRLYGGKDGSIFSEALYLALTFMVVLVLLIQPYRFSMGTLTFVITLIVALGCLYYPGLAFVAFTIGIARTICNSVARLSAVIYWAFWPFWKFVLRVLAVVCAWYLGNHIWYSYFENYHEYKNLQAYSNVDSYSQSGNRLQDSGLVVFNSSDGVDRARGGCIVNGHIYCVAPIMIGGTVKKGVSQTYTGMQDLFMAGIDCCDCSEFGVSDFRCGDWADPTHENIGGMRLLDEGARKMYRLAAEKWMANWNKRSVHTIFYHWTNDPIAAWKTLLHHGSCLAVLAIFGAFFGSFLVIMLLNALIHFLVVSQIAAPIDDGNQAFEDDPLLAMQREQHRGPSWVPQMYHGYETQKEPQMNEFEYAEAKYVVL